MSHRGTEGAARGGIRIWISLVKIGKRRDGGSQAFSEYDSFLGGFVTFIHQKYVEAIMVAVDFNCLVFLYTSFLSLTCG